MICDYFQMGGRSDEHPSNIPQRDLDAGLSRVMAQRAQKLIDLNVTEQLIWCPWGTWRQDGRKIPVRPDDPAPGWTDQLFEGIEANEDAGIKTILYFGDIGESNNAQIDALWPVLSRLSSLGRHTLCIFDHTSNPTTSELSVLYAVRNIYGLPVGIEALPSPLAPTFNAAFAWATTAVTQLQNGHRFHPSRNYFWLNYSPTYLGPDLRLIPWLSAAPDPRFLTNLDDEAAASQIENIRREYDTSAIVLSNLSGTNRKPAR